MILPIIDTAKTRKIIYESPVYQNVPVNFHVVNYMAFKRSLA